MNHEFVELMPSSLADGTLYVSIPYETAVHLCACGCGNKVVTPISPADWSLTFDGETVSLHPSIGSWQLPCRSHYLIKRNQVRWAGAWTDKQIKEGRERDAEDADRYFASRLDETGHSADLDTMSAESTSPPRRKRFLDRLFRR